jgi:hypothetical protein
VDQSRSKDVVCIIYFKKNMFGLVRTLLGQYLSVPFYMLLSNICSPME